MSLLFFSFPRAGDAKRDVARRNPEMFSEFYPLSACFLGKPKIVFKDF